MISITSYEQAVLNYEFVNDNAIKYSDLTWSSQVIDLHHDFQDLSNFIPCGHCLQTNRTVGNNSYNLNLCIQCPSTSCILLITACTNKGISFAPKYYKATKIWMSYARQHANTYQSNCQEGCNKTSRHSKTKRDARQSVSRMKNDATGCYFVCRQANCTH